MPRQRRNVPPAKPQPSVEAMRLALVRKLDKFVADWRRCPRRVCRRLRTCTPEHDFCTAPKPPAPPTTPEQWEDTKAELLRLLARRLAEIGKENAELPPAATSSPPSA